MEVGSVRRKSIMLIISTLVAVLGGGYLLRKLWRVAHTVPNHNEDMVFS